MRRLLIVWLAACALLVTADPIRSEVITSGPRACHGIALTFDLCPVRDRSGYDEALIDLLKEKRIPATFFLSGRWMVRHEHEVRALLAVPFFEIGTHGRAHAHLPLLDEEAQRHEIQDAVTLLRGRYGRTAPLFRPPYGEYNETTVKIVETLGLRFILWNVISGDPDPHLSRVQIVRAVKAGARNGSIIVFHANGKGRYTRDVIDDLYQDLVVQQHFRPMTVTDLFTCSQQTAP